MRTSHRLDPAAWQRLLKNAEGIPMESRMYLLFKEDSAVYIGCGCEDCRESLLPQLDDLGPRTEVTKEEFYAAVAPSLGEA